MATIYVFHDELPEGGAPALADMMLIWDTSAGLMKRSTMSNIWTAIGRTAATGASAADTIGFYGATPVNQGVFTATALTALATATISAGNAAGVWAFASSTAMEAFVTRAKQAQADLENLMTKLNTVGLVSVDGV